MKFRLIGSMTATSLLLLTCASCQLSDFDSNGDGVVTRQEFISTLIEAACDEPSEPEGSDEESPDPSEALEDDLQQ